MVSGSTADNEPVPPHFEFSTTAKRDDNKQLNNSLIEYMMSVGGNLDVAVSNGGFPQSG